MRIEEKEFLSFNRNMLLHCCLLFLGICAGLWIHGYCLILVAGFTVLVALFGKLEYSYYHLLFSLPYTMIYKLSPSSTSLFAYTMLAVGAIMLFRIKRFGKRQLILIVIYFAYLLPGMGNNYTLVLKMTIGLILLYYFVMNVEPADYKNHVMSFSLGMVGSSFLGLLKTSWPRLTMYFSDMNPIWVDGEQTSRFSALYLDPNYFSVSVLFAMFLCVMLLLNKQGGRILLIPVIVALTAFGFLTYSKMFLLVFVLMMLLFILWEARSPKRIIGTLVVVLLAGGVLIQWLLKSGYVDVIIDRLSGDDISTGRFDIWKIYFEYMLEHPITLLIGDGVGAPNQSGVAPHNTYIESMYMLGIMGSALFLLAIISILVCRRFAIKRNIMNYALIVFFGIMAGTLGCLTNNDLLYYCMLIWIGLNFDTYQSRRVAAA